MKTIKKITILDDHYMRASGYAALLSRAGLGFDPDGTDVTISDASSLCLDEALSGQDACIYVVGAESLTDVKVQEIIRTCRIALQDRPLILLSDQVVAEDIRAAINVGISGIVPTHTRPEIAIAAIRFIFSGGHYFPHAVSDVDAKIPMSAAPTRVRYTDPKAIKSADMLANVGQSAGGAMDPLAEGARMAAPDDGVTLTERQNDVMLSLEKGWSNKEIGRSLNLSESTVKVHIRHLMRKFGMNNRTQLALIMSSARSANWRHKMAQTAPREKNGRLFIDDLHP
ncbi:two component transcriptional regulator, LuxR family [Loktanella salsilacus]|jgi:DNA-binding NarL/FixJ family response regulator|uniref:Two component transcriptional regulator, LuxR family n=1 Tax=Loktanella salsilacus TaxID=195913 RepID=A0A1I4JJ10_9RHOB|nr:response regulator transcription factor [Loktanella salsilacus]SFL66096.1 two component transcriptional regulator, LuxR family [Loktanella salsilacus]